MAFRLSTERGTSTTVRLAGRLADDAVDVLVGACGGTAVNLTVDLSEVYYADEAGVRALGRLRARGAVLRRPRPYLAILLAHETGPLISDGESDAPVAARDARGR